MQYIDMSGKLPMGIATNLPRVRYSAAYPTGAERIAKRTSLPWGLVCVGGLKLFALRHLKAFRK